MLEARNLSVSIGSRTIIAAVDFVARPGEVTAIIGPNGSGKTTLLRALSSDLAFHGDVLINGVSLRGLRPSHVATLRAVLPQASQLNFPFTVHEVVRMGVTAGVAGSDAADLPARALARVDLTGFGHRLYADLSGGEQQRVQLARVLCQVWQPTAHGKPRYLLLDEPVSSLDIRHQLMVMQIARDFAQAGGGVVAVLHDLNLASLHADRVLAMRDGCAIRLGTPGEVIEPSLIDRVFGCALRPVDFRPGGRLFAPEVAA